MFHARLRVSAALFAATGFATALPEGICLHSYGPLAPADKIECFEYVKFEKVSGGIRFFLHPNGSAIVPDIRYRGVVVYMPNLQPGDPKFDETLELYLQTSTRSPSTRRYLNGRITNMQALNDEYQARKRHDAGLKRITLGGTVYKAPAFKSLADGLLTISHSGGAGSIDIGTITESEWRAFQEIDKAAGGVKVISVGGKRLWNPRFDGLTLTGVKIANAKETVTFDLDSLAQADRKKLEALSDGSWHLVRPGFVRIPDDSESYAELTCYDGRTHKRVKLIGLVGDKIAIETSQGEHKLPIKEAFELPGKSKMDRTKTADWLDELMTELFKNSPVKTDSDVVSFEKANDLSVTNVRARILQVLDGGVLASEFAGTLHSGENVIKVTRTVSATNPVTGNRETKVVDETTGKVAVTEPVTDDLCFIAGEGKALAERQIVNILQMKLDGTYEYIAVNGAKRVVRRYRVQ